MVQLAGVTGVILWLYDYDAFGNEREIEGQDALLDTNPFRYCAEYFDKETGSIYLRARYYSPVLGRFRTEDPIRDGLNWYIYAGDNPLFYVDPSGLVEVSLRDYLNKNYVIDNKYIVWDAKTRGATVTYMGITHTFYGTIASEGEYRGVMRIDDSLIIKYFGINFYEPPSKSLIDPMLETIPIVNYGQAALGRNLDGKQLTSAQRSEKLATGLNQSVDALESAAIMSGIRMTAPQATAAALKIGYKRTNYTSHGQTVYERVSGSGPKYITPDVDIHSGGTWKGADTVKDLSSKTTRAGTYSEILQRMGD